MIIFKSSINQVRLHAIYKCYTSLESSFHADYKFKKKLWSSNACMVRKLLVYSCIFHIFTIFENIPTKMLNNFLCMVFLFMFMLSKVIKDIICLNCVHLDHHYQVQQTLGVCESIGNRHSFLLKGIHIVAILRTSLGDSSWHVMHKLVDILS